MGLLIILGLFVVLALFWVMTWCFLHSPTQKEVEDYYNAIMRETMHELKEYDTRKR